MQHAELSTATTFELLDLALETAGMSVWEWDLRSGKLLQRSSRALELGFEAETMPTTAQQWIERVHPSDRDESLRAMDACLTGSNASFDTVLRIAESDGNFRWVRVQGRVGGRDERGAPIRFLGVTQDVHRLHTVEETVRRNAELFERIPDSVVCTDLDGVVTYWNQGATELYGWTADEMLGRNIIERFPPEARSEVETIQARLGTGQEFLAEFLDYRKDGSRIWVEARIARYGAPNRPAGIMGFARDASKRRAAQEMLLRDASILSQLQDIVVCLDFDRKVTYWNDAAERILGWKREEMLGRDVSLRLPPSVFNEVNSVMTQTLAGEAVLSKEWEDYRKDGSRVWIDWRAETLRDGDGNAIGVTSVGSDITARRAADEERKRLEAQLFHAQKMESLGTMAGGIAHDFNNTLAVILVYAEMALARDDLDAPLIEALDQIRRSGARARDLVARILTFSRSQEPQRSVVDLRALMLDYEKLARATLPATVDLRVVVGEPAPALVDPTQVHQVLMNLCVNAAQAMNDRGSLGIELSQERVAEHNLSSGTLCAGSYAVIQVTDDGAGMSADTLAHAFEPFFTTKPVGKGTGLGLATAIAIARSHGGGVDVQSALGQGSCFRVYLPLAEESVPSPTTISLPPASGRGQRVLVLDDEDAVAVLTRTALQALGYYADCVFSPEVFLERFLEAPGRWDLLITDQTMPRTTGIELSRRLRNFGHSVPILITTGFSREVTTEALRAAGCNGLLRKPFDMDELARAIGRALSSPGASTATEGA